MEENEIRAIRKQKNPYKSKKGVLEETRKPSGQKSFLEKMKILKEDGTKINIDKKSLQRMKSLFTIKIPSALYFRLQGIETQVFFMDDLTQKAEINMYKGLLRAKRLQHKESSISSKNCNVYAEIVIIEKLLLDDVSKGIFGFIQDTNCLFKGSRVELGSIGKGIDINDYNSKIYFYNFEKDFEELNFIGDYTELLVYDFDKKVKMKAKGSITLVFDEDDVVSSSFKGVKPSENIHGKKVEEESYGKLEVNLENGVLHLISEKSKKLEKPQKKQ